MTYLPATLILQPIDPRDVEARQLLRALDAELLSRYPSESVYGLDPTELEGPRAIFLVARLGLQAVGCGGLRELNQTTAELKRMFVRPEYRGQGIARHLLGALERFAGQKGYHSIHLETGTRQPEALGLYESRGYRFIPCFGDYADDPFSLCLEKAVAAGNPEASCH